MKDMDGIQRDAVKLKFIDAPLSKDRLAELIQIPPQRDSRTNANGAFAEGRKY
jgi:hypothetical protein